MSEQWPVEIIAMPPDVHARLKVQAQNAGISFHTFCADILDRAARSNVETIYDLVLDQEREWYCEACWAIWPRVAR